MEIELIEKAETYRAVIDEVEYDVNVMYFEGTGTHHFEVINEDGTILDLKDIPEEIKDFIKKEYPEVGL